MRVAIVGAGAMGSVFGARLAEAGVDTTLFDVDADLVEVLRRDGVRLMVGEEEKVVPIAAAADPDSVRPVDAVFFFVKCHQTAAAAARFEALVGGDTAVVSLQNGWGNADVLAAHFDPSQLVVGITYTSATVIAPGQVRTSGPGPTALGPFEPPAAAFADRVAESLAAAGFPVERPAEIRTEIWKKLVLNAASLPTAALTGLAAGSLTADPAMDELVDAGAAEAVAVGRALGFPIDPAERRDSIRAALGSAGGNKASMLQDVEAGRRTEIDVISGAVLRGAAEHGVPVPVTSTLHALVVGLELGRGLR